MLPEILKPFNYGCWDREEWSAYVERLDLPDQEAIRQFYRQVVYDHLDHFNNHFPDFELDDYAIGMEQFTAAQANDQVRFLGNKEMDWWGEQYDEFAAKNQPYIIYQEMSKNLTPPFPPVLIHSTQLVDSGWCTYGRPFHLVEGTHRVSYLRHMLHKGLITPDSTHNFVVLRHRSASGVPSNNSFKPKPLRGSA
jgi:hypothetical protein